MNCPCCQSTKVAKETNRVKFEKSWASGFFTQERNDCQSCGHVWADARQRERNSNEFDRCETRVRRMLKRAEGGMYVH